MKINLKLLSIVLVLAVFLSSCGSIQFVPKATATEIPTQTALPTYTPMPTYTPYPTATLIPTDVPTPTAVPVKNYTVNGVTLEFTGVTLSTSTITIGEKNLTPDPGYSVLVLSGTYNGNMDNLFGQNGAYQPMGVFYILDNKNENREWVYEYHVWQNIQTNGTFQICFFVKTDEDPYILHSTIGDTPFTINLTKFLSDI